MPGDADRSVERLVADDLKRLAEIAAEDEAALLARRPQGAGRYAGRLLGRALCQGAALHLLDGRNGIKDFDVWSFYAAQPDGAFPPRRRGTADFGRSRFGRWSGDGDHFTGRRVDLIGRSVPADVGDDPVVAMRAWLRSDNKSAGFLAAKAVVMLEPAALRGTVAWPVSLARAQ